MTDQVRAYWETWARSVAAGPLSPTERLELADELMRVAAEEPRINARVAELERWQQVDFVNYKLHLADLTGKLTRKERDLDTLDDELTRQEIRIAELTEMLTAATDVAVQRGKVLDAIRARCINEFGEPFLAEDIEHILDGADGG